MSASVLLCGMVLNEGFKLKYANISRGVLKQQTCLPHDAKSENIRDVKHRIGVMDVIQGVRENDVINERMENGISEALLDVF